MVVFGMLVSLLAVLVVPPALPALVSLITATVPDETVLEALMPALVSWDTPRVLPLCTWMLAIVLDADALPFSVVIPLPDMIETVDADVAPEPLDAALDMPGPDETVLTRLLEL